MFEISEITQKKFLRVLNFVGGVMIGLAVLSPLDPSISTDPFVSLVLIGTSVFCLYVSYLCHESLINKGDAV